MLTDKPEESGLDAKNRAERDRVDLHDEIAGRGTSRIKRFLPHAFDGLPGETEEQKAEREFQSLLDLLLSQDPHYAALYTKVSDKLEKAKQAVDQALIYVNQRLEESVRALQNLRHSAAELEDGTKIFQSERDSGVYTEHGERLTDEETQEVVIPDHAPSWEDYQAAQAAHETALRQKQEIETYQHDVLEPITEQMQDEDNPPTMEELEEFEERLESAMPDAVKARFLVNGARVNTSPAVSAAHDMGEDIDLNVPDMADAFKHASVEIEMPNLDLPASENVLSASLPPIRTS